MTLANDKTKLVTEKSYERAITPSHLRVGHGGILGADVVEDVAQLS